MSDRRVTETQNALRIRAETATSPECVDLLDASTVALRRSLPAEDIFTLDAQELDAPNVTFMVARKGKLAVGCVALVDQTTYGEIKRLFVRDMFRGQGIAQELIRAVEQVCCDVGLQDIKIETSPLLAAAEKLYRSMGYVPCDAFGGYPVLDSSLFMHKELCHLDQVLPNGG